MNWTNLILAGVVGFGAGLLAAKVVPGTAGVLPHWPYNYGPDRFNLGAGEPIVIGTLPHWPYNYGPDRLALSRSGQPLVIGKRQVGFGGGALPLRNYYNFGSFNPTWPDKQALKIGMMTG